MNLRRGIWMEVEPGVYIQDPQLRLWYVEKMERGWLLVRNRAGEYRSLPPPAGLDLPVIIAEPTMEEAIEVCRRVLGAEEWGKAEALARHWTRAQQLKLDLPAKNRDAYHSHIFLAHGEYVGDVKTVKRMIECHETLHREPTHRMSLPHHHAPIISSSSTT